MVLKRFAAMGVAAALIAAVAGCSSAASGPRESDKQPWTFTDGSGKTVKLDDVPKRIIAHGGEAAALMSFGIRPVGIYADTAVEDDPSLEGLDLSGIAILGEVWGEIDVEKAAELNPDLIVADWWPVEGGYSGLEDGAKDSSKKLQELAPIVGIAQGDSIAQLIAGYERLADSLGAELDSPDVAAGKEAFEAAVTEFKKTVAAKDELTALAVSPSDDLLYVAVPKHAPELLDFASWGLNVIKPADPDEAFPYWENLSWENADKYQPDLLLIDDRSYPANLKTAQKHPTWESINAAAAGAVVPWPAYWLHTYSDYAMQLAELTQAIKAADPTIGS